MVIPTSSSRMFNSMTLFGVLKLILSQRLIKNLLLAKNATSSFSWNLAKNMLREFLKIKFIHYNSV